MNPAELQAFGRHLHGWGANVTAILPDTKQPGHKWQQWQHQRQTLEELNALPWQQAAAVGVVNGSGYFRLFDIDAPKDKDGRPLYQVDEQVIITILQAIGLPRDYQWSYRSGSGAGWGFVIRCQEDLPAEWTADKGIFTGLPHSPFFLTTWNYGGIEGKP